MKLEIGFWKVMNLLLMMLLQSIWKEGCNDTTCNKNLTLLMDSCYSGSWVNRLRNDDTMQNFPICFISATSADGFLVNAFSGVFTEEIFRESITSNSVMVYTTASYKII